jgi:hypothetical protein
MAVPQSRKLKIITFTLAGTQFQCQLKSWTMNNNTEDGEKFYTYCGVGAEGEFREEAEPDYSLDLTFFADWRLNGISDYLTANDQATVAFVLDHHPDIAGEFVRWSGNLKIKAPSVGGEARTTEMTETTLPCIGKPAYTRM